MLRQRLYSVIKGRRTVTPEMAVRFEKHSAAAPTCGLGCRPPMTSRKCTNPKKRSEKDGVRSLIAARQGFTDANRGAAAVTGTATCACALIHVTLALRLVCFLCSRAYKL